MSDLTFLVHVHTSLMLLSPRLPSHERHGTTAHPGRHRKTAVRLAGQVCPWRAATPEARVADADDQLISAKSRLSPAFVRRGIVDAHPLPSHGSNWLPTTSVDGA